MFLLFCLFFLGLQAAEKSPVRIQGQTPERAGLPCSPPVGIPMSPRIIVSDRSPKPKNEAEQKNSPSSSMGSDDDIFHMEP